MKKISKKELLFQFIKDKNIVNTVDIRKWGLSNFYITADRGARRMAQFGEIKRLTEEEIILRGSRKEKQARIAWYEY